MAKSRARKLADIIVGAGIDIDGNLTFDGGSTSADLTFADNDKANFGDASDLQIYHDGSHSEIKESGVGDLRIRGDSIWFLETDGTNQLSLYSGAAKLYNNGSEKLATTSSGVTVTGGLTSSGNVTLAGTGNKDVYLGTTGSTEAAYISRYNNDFYLMNKDSGDLIFGTNNSNKGRFTSSGNFQIGTTTVIDSSRNLTNIGTISSGAITSTGQITARSDFVAADSGGTARGYLFGTSGGLFLRYNSGSNLQIQEAGSTRVTVDAGGEVGIGRTPSNYRLEVEALTGGNALKITRGSGTQFNLFQSGDGTTHMGTSGTNGHLVFRTGTTVGTDTERMRIDSSGNVGIGAAPQTTVGALDLVGNASNYSTSPMITFRDTSGQSTARNWSLGNIAINYGDFHIGCGDTNSDYFDATAHSKFTIKSSGNVGIGTVSPVEKLHVNGNIRFGSGTPAHIYTNANELRLSVDNNNDNGISDITFYVDASEKARIDENGRLGIGSTSPQKNLSIGSAQAEGIQFNYDSTNNYRNQILNYWNTATDSRMDFNIARNSGQTPQTIMSVGYNSRVGIGTTAPSGKLHVSSGNQALGFDAGVWVSANPSDYTVGRGAGITMQNADVYTGGIYGIRELNSWNGALAFYTHTGSSGNTFGTTFTEKMRISSDGKVGIGTTAPSQHLEISKASARMKLTDGTNQINFGLWDGTNYRLEGDANRPILITSYHTDGIRLGGSGSAHVTIKSGSLGVGNTNPGSPLDVYNNGGTYAALFYQTSSDTAKYNAIRVQGAMTSVTGYYGIGGSTTSNTSFRDTFVVGTQTAHSFNLATSDTARVTIDSSGNTGVGTTSPQQKLAVVEGTNYEPPGLGNSGGNFGIFKTDSNVSGDYGIMWGVRSNGSVWQQVQRRDGTATAYHMLLQPSGGNVGIGESSPSQKLHVAGNILSTGNYHYFVSANNYIEVDQNTGTRFRFHLNGYKQAELIRVSGANGQFAVNQFSTGSTAADYPAFTSMDDNNTGLFFPADNQVGLTTNGSEALRVGPTGDVAIGTTGGNGRRLEVATSNDFVAKFESTDAYAGIILEDSNSTTDYNRIAAVGNTLVFAANNVNRATISSEGIELPEGNEQYKKRAHYFTQSGVSSFSTSTNVTYTQGNAAMIAQGEVLIGQVSARAYTDHINIRTNLAANNIMFYFRTIGYFYSYGMEECYAGGYTYYSGGNTVLSKDYRRTLGDTHNIRDLYRDSNGFLCMRIEVNHTGYTEGKMLIYMGGHNMSGTTITGVQITDVIQRDDGTNAF